MSQLQKNLILEGIFASEVMDSSGEILDIKGADISDLQKGTALLNTEHQNPEDIAKSKDAKEDPQKGFETIIGRVINAKKIFSEEDCKNDKELDAFINKSGKKPLIYGQVEIYDGPEAPENAKAAAALARMFMQDPNGPQFGLSVEGSTLKRDKNVLKETVIRRMAATLKPCNKVAWIQIAGDTSSNTSQVAKSEYRTYADGTEPLYKSVSMQQMYVVPAFNDFGLSKAAENLRKALAAGGYNSAPSSLTGGSALQKESNLTKLARKMSKTSFDKDSLKKEFPGIDDEKAEKVIKALKKYMFDRNLEECEKIYKSIQ